MNLTSREKTARYRVKILAIKNPHIPSTQICSKCAKRKSRKYFSKNEHRRNKLNGWCKKCMKKISKKYLKSKAKQSREARVVLRLEVLTHYSKGKPHCACCKIFVLEFLGIDHIKGGGNRHKRIVRHIYLWLRKNGFPKGFRVLCHNCNQSLGAYGYCPHDTK
jgi:hypothetical protein